MLESLTLFDMASAMARHAGRRHSVIAENVANADTPGFRARDLEDFASVVKGGLTPRATRPGHVGAIDAAFAPGTGPGAGMRARIVDAGGASSPNGNTVNLPEQTMKAVEAQASHALATTIYRKAIDILRIGLGPNR